MSIREASPLGQYPTLPAGSDVLTTWSIRAHDLPEPSRYPGGCTMHKGLANLCLIPPTRSIGLGVMRGSA
jgi:hypothetical protein